MADQRSAFRFRFPWLAPSQATRPSTASRPPAQSTARATPSSAPAPQRTAGTPVLSQPTATTTPTAGQSTASATPSQASQRTAETGPASTTTATPAQSTVSATLTPAPQGTADTQPTATTTPTPAQSTESASTAPAPQRTAETQPTTAITTPAQSTGTPERTAETQVPSQITPTTASTPAQSTTSATPPLPPPQRRAETQVLSEPTPPTRAPTPAPQLANTETPTQPPTSMATNATTEMENAEAPKKSTAIKISSSTTPQRDEIEAARQSVASPITPGPADTQIAQIQPPVQSTAPTTTIAANAQTAEAQPHPPAATARQPNATSSQATHSQPQAAKTESQPSSPSRVTSQSRVSSQPVSPSRATTQSRSQPSSPSGAPSQPRTTSQLSSPSRTGPPNSPTRRTASQPRTPPRMASQQAGRTSLTSPSSNTATPPTATLPESTSPSKREQRLSPQSSQPSSISTENPSAVLEKESKFAVSEQQSLEELQLKEESMAYDSQNQTPVEASTEPNGTTLQPIKESEMRTTATFDPPRGPQTSVSTQKSDAPTITGPKSFPEETKEVKEIVQETNEKTYKEGKDKDEYLLARAPNSALHAKEQPNITFQAQKTVDRKEKMAAPTSNRKDLKTTDLPRNKSVSVESLQKPARTHRERTALHKEIRNDISELVQKVAAGDTTHSIGDRPFSVITLAGENRGAAMHLATDSMRKGGAVPIHRGYKVNPNEGAETTTDGESIKIKPKEAKDSEDQAADAFVNSNVQGINNSIVFNSSLTDRNPGVHLVHSRFPTKMKAETPETEILQTAKTELSMSRAQKLTYEPRVKRRCLRGLFLESSDSDPENTTKPQRHGCRVGCKEEKSKEKKIDIF